MRTAIRVGVCTAALAVSGLALAGEAYGYWTSRGTGTGTATTGTTTITLSGVGSASGLYPGASFAGVHITVTNTAASKGTVNVTAASAGTTTIATAGPVTTGSTCDPRVVTFTPTTLPAAIAPGSSADVVGKVTMGTSAGNQCQGATFSIPVTVTGKVG